MEDRFIELIIKGFANIYGAQSCSGIINRVYESLEPEEREKCFRRFQRIMSVLEELRKK